jgi:vesicle-associated membrane protein 7
VSRKDVVLVEHSKAHGNFVQISRMLLSKIDANVDTKQCYETGDHLFYYTVSNGFIFFCIADKQTTVTRAFGYLTELRSSFLQKFGTRASTVAAFSLNDEFERTMASLMEFSTNSKTDKFSQIHEQIDATVDVMVQNLERVLQRGEKIELLVQKTEELQANSLEFRKVSTDLKNHYWWRNVKLWIIAGVCVIILIWLISSLICGFNYKNCSKKKS